MTTEMLQDMRKMIQEATELESNINITSRVIENIKNRSNKSIEDILQSLCIALRRVLDKEELRKMIEDKLEILIYVFCDSLSKNSR